MATNGDKPTLAEYVNARMIDLGFSLRDVETRSHHHITKSYVNKIRNGIVTNPSPDKLKALAKGLDRPEEEIFDIVLGVEAQPGEFEKRLLYEVSGHSNWTDNQKRRFIETVRLLVAGIRSERSVDSM